MAGARGALFVWRLAAAEDDESTAPIAARITQPRGANDEIIDAVVVDVSRGADAASGSVSANDHEADASVAAEAREQARQEYVSGKVAGAGGVASVDDVTLILPAAEDQVADSVAVTSPASLRVTPMAPFSMNPVSAKPRLPSPP